MCISDMEDRETAYAANEPPLGAFVQTHSDFKSSHTPENLLSKDPLLSDEKRHVDGKTSSIREPVGQTRTTPPDFAMAGLVRSHADEHCISNGSSEARNDDSLAIALTNMTPEERLILNHDLAQRAALIKSVELLANHVPVCVLTELHREILSKVDNEGKLLESRSGAHSYLSPMLLESCSKNSDSPVKNESAHAQLKKCHGISGLPSQSQLSDKMDEGGAESERCTHGMKCNVRSLQRRRSLDAGGGSGKTNAFVVNKRRHSYPYEPEPKVSQVGERKDLSANSGCSSQLDSGVCLQSQQAKTSHRKLQLPYISRHDCALLFVDISGFTKLSRLLDVESLSKAINSYFNLIVNEVTSHGGDILKFAGDAVFAEWRPSRDGGLICANLEDCVFHASCCGAKIVSSGSDFPIYDGEIAVAGRSVVATLNVHCGVAVGELVGVHVGDSDKRREYLFLGDPINQIIVAEESASLGEMVASQEAISFLERRCLLDPSVLSTPGKAALIANRSTCLFRPKPAAKHLAINTGIGSLINETSIAIQCQCLDTKAIHEYRRLISLYVHPVVAVKELERRTYRRRSSIQNRHREEAELRIVYTMFIMPLVDSKVTQNEIENSKLFKLLHDIMNLVTRELDRFKGHLRQFIVDDKGIVLIATFGLRGSSFPNMVTERALPATTLIHSLLTSELGVDSHIGGTMGDAYCGIVGGLRRHEFAVMGPSVNLSARLMCSPENPGILVDNAVRLKADKRFGFAALPPVKAKGYPELVPIFEPLSPLARRWGKVKRSFVGRQNEMRFLENVARSITQDSFSRSKLVLVSAEAGTGKTAMIVHTIDHIRRSFSQQKIRVILTRHVCNERDYLLPFSIVRNILLDSLAVMGMSKDELCIVGDGVDDNSEIMSSLSLSSLTKATVDNRRVLEQLYALARDLDSSEQTVGIVGRILGLESICQESSKVKADLEAVVQFMAKAMVRCTEHAELVLLALDDVHWMDDMSWKVVQALFERGRKLMIVCASRPLTTCKPRIDADFWEELKAKYREESRYHEVVLHPMGQEGIRAIIAQQLGLSNEKPISEKLQLDIYQHSGGMPHFASEIVEYARRNDLFRQVDGALSWKKQPSINLSGIDDLMIHRIDGMESGVQPALRIGAVLGSSFDLLEVVAVDEQLAEVDFHDRYQHAERVHMALDHAVMEGILEEVVDGGEEEDGSEFEDVENLSKSSGNASAHPYCHHNRTYSFTHDMWRSVILKLMLDVRKKDIHRSIAEALEYEGVGQTDDFQFMFKLFSHWKESGEREKAADTSLRIGESFADLGLHNQRVRVYEDALDMWVCGDATGAISHQALEAMCASSIEYVIKLEIALGQTLANLHKGKESVHAYQNALYVIQTAPASAQLDDRSVVFPIFSGLFVALKFGQIQQDRECLYEQELVKRFVDETRLNGDPIHYTRALAMLGEVYGRLGHFDKALEAHSKLAAVYDVHLHSAGVCKAYNSDRSGQSFGMSSLWHMVLGNNEAALEACSYVINELLPSMDPHNCHNSAIMIYPCLWVMKDNGLALTARDTFRMYVADAFREYFPDGATTFCLPLYRPLAILLTLAGMEGKEVKEIEEFVNWTMDGNNLRFSNIIDNSMANFGRNANSITAEICLLLAKRLGKGETRSNLIRTGLELAWQSIELTRGENAAPGLIIAYRQVKPVCDDLQRLCDEEFDQMSYRAPQ